MKVPALVVGVSLAVCLTGSVLADAATLRGRLVSSEGYSIRRAQVPLTAIEETPPGHYMTHTDNKGQFTWDDVPVGAYLLTAEKSRWQPVRMTVNVAARNVFEPQSVTVQMELTPLAFMLTRLQMGSVIYVWLFGLLVLLFNFYLVPASAA